MLKPHQNVNSQLEFAFNNSKKNNRSVSRLSPNFHSFVLVLPHFPVSSVYLLIFPIFSFYIFILPVSSVYLFIFPHFFFLSFYPSHSLLFISSTFSPSFRLVAVRTWAGLVVSGGVLGRQGCSHRRPGQPSLPRVSPGLGSDVIQRSKEGQGAFSTAENQPGCPG